MNQLKEKFFETTSGLDDLNLILSKLGNFQVSGCTREEYEKMNGNIFSLGQDDIILVHIPENLCFGDLIYIIRILYKEFKLPASYIHEYTSIIKTAIGLLIKNGVSEEEIHNYAEILSIPQDFHEEIQTAKINKHARRKFSSLTTSNNAGDIKNSILKKLSEILSVTFDTSFLSHSLQELGENMMTISSGEVQKKKDDLERKGYKDIGNGILMGEKGLATFRDHSLGNVQLLKERIGIVSLKEKIAVAKESGNQDELYDIYHESASIISEALFKYPYVQSEEWNGGFPKQIQNTKEVYCVGYSILGHIFLEELGIDHKVLQIPLHSAIEVRIGEKKYLFDPTNSQELREIKYIEKVGWYNKIEAKDGQPTQGDKVFSDGDNKSILFGQIVGNLANTTGLNDGIWKKLRLHIFELYCAINGAKMLDQGRRDLAIKFSELCLEINPESSLYRMQLALYYYFEGRYQEGLQLINIFINKLEKSIKEQEISFEQRYNIYQHPQVPINNMLKIRALLLLKIGKLSDFFRQISFLSKVLGESDRKLMNEILRMKSLADIERKLVKNLG